MSAKIIVLLACVSACVAHLCMLSPPQRSPLTGINKPGSRSCFMLGAPCGKQAPNINKLYLSAGENFTVVFQKNLNHFYAANPNNRTLTELYRTADTSDPSLTIMTANIMVPRPVVEQPFVIQTQYVSNNPTEPPAFYQCADVVIML
ncbi:uncharacterized protein [Littorina saxatilis]|uniref:uncharacterized protein isoform X2 n=1 Tax=Littorina saxatilis TaxID=31220 RepID=UPI0038B5CA19